MIRKIERYVIVLFRSCLNRQIENIFINVLFFLFENTEISNYLCNHELESVVSKLEFYSEQLSKWLDDNIKKIDADKSNFVIDFMLLFKKLAKRSRLSTPHACRGLYSEKSRTVGGAFTKPNFILRRSLGDDII